MELVLVLVFPSAFVVYFLALRYFLRSWRYRWAVWLWAMTFILQLPFFFKWEWGRYLGEFLLVPFHCLQSIWHRTPLTAFSLLLVPSVPAFFAWAIQYRRHTRLPAPPTPPRPWVVPVMLATYLVMLLALVWWLHNG